MGLAENVGGRGAIQIRGKLFCILALMLVACVGISVTAGRKITVLGRSIEAVHDRGLQPVSAILSLRGDIAEARAVLNAMLGEPVEARQKVLHQHIRALSLSADQHLAGLHGMSQLEAGERERIQALKAQWEEFKKTREDKLIPLLYAGDADSALSLARGVQAQRYEAMGRILSGLAADLGRARA